MLRYTEASGCRNQIFRGTSAPVVRRKLQQSNIEKPQTAAWHHRLSRSTRNPVVIDLRSALRTVAVAGIIRLNRRRVKRARIPLTGSNHDASYEVPFASARNETASASGTYEFARTSCHQSRSIAFAHRRPDRLPSAESRPTARRRTSLSLRLSPNLNRRMRRFANRPRRLSSCATGHLSRGQSLSHHPTSLPIARSGRLDSPTGPADFPPRSR